MKRKKIGSVDVTPIILIGGIGVLGYMFWDKISGFFNSSANQANNDAINASTTQAIAASLAAQQNTGEKATLGAAALSALATQIYNAGISGSPPDEQNQDTIERAIIQVNNMTDLLLLQQSFGTKQAGGSFFSSCSLTGQNCQTYDLSSWVAQSLDSAHLSAVNQYLSMQGINFYF